MNQNLLYAGRVRHRRYVPKYHEFSYNMYYFYFNPEALIEVAKQIPLLSIDRFNYLAFNQKDFFRINNNTIRQSINNLFDVNQKQDYPIYILSQLSCLGYCFNPLTLYFRISEREVSDMVLEVHNTPWGEKKAYVLNSLKRKSDSIYHCEFDKALHVSPFMTMDYQYHLNLKINPINLILHIENRKSGKKHFDATLCLEGMPFTQENLHKLIHKNPFPAQKTVMGIYWQALQLYLKGIPFVSHPKGQQSNDLNL